MKLFNSALTIGINVNDTSCEMVVIDTKSHPHKIIAAKRTPLADGTISHGVIINELQLLRALASLKSQCGIAEREACQAVVSVSDEVSFPFSLPFDQAQNDSLAEVIQKGIDDIVPLRNDQRKIFILTPIEAGQVYGIAMNRHVVQAYYGVCNRLNIHIMGFEPDHLAVARYCMPEAHKAHLFTIVDIGEAVTHLTAVRNGYPLISYSMPFGADHISTHLHGAIRRQREQFKIQHVTEGVEQEAMHEAFIPFFQELNNILKRMHSLIADALGPQKDLHIICTGGGSLLPHIIEQLQAHLHTPVHAATIGSALDVSKIPERELALFTQAIGSACLHRRTSTITLSQLTAAPQQHISHLSIQAFKKRTTILLSIFGILLIILVAIAIVRFAPNDAVNANVATFPVVPASQSTPQENAQTLDVFGVTFSIGDGFAEKKIDITRTQKKEISTTGKRDVAGRAEGMVTIYNNENNPRNLVRLTRLQAESGNIFRIQSDITIPANGTVKATVLADEPGTAGNLPPGKLTIPGINQSAQANVFAENTEAFTGGIQTVSMVSENDITEATKQLTEMLQSEISRAIEDQSDDARIAVLAEPIHITATSDPEVGSSANQTTVTVSGVSQGVVFKKSEVEARLTDRLSGATITEISYTVTSFNPETGKGILQYTALWK